MADEAHPTAVTLEVAPGPDSGAVLAIRLPCGTPVLVEMPRDAARALIRGLAAAIGDGFERTFGAEARHA